MLDHAYYTMGPTFSKPHIKVGPKSILPAQLLDNILDFRGSQVHGELKAGEAIEEDGIPMEPPPLEKLKEKWVVSPPGGKLHDEGNVAEQLWWTEDSDKGSRFWIHLLDPTGEELSAYPNARVSGWGGGEFLEIAAGRIRRDLRGNDDRAAAFVVADGIDRLVESGDHPFRQRVARFG